ncbi:MAG: hypothetical protein JSS44_07570 [Proteobacteria bacterium]|nr:hypothetical protein [Pseudomonadota bacterium]MBS0465376.1 hypothetical protein [Pseudomonadota bacterium]
MNTAHPLQSGLLAAAIATLFVAALPATALACGEGQFNTGKGLAYQGYLAPRPATVLIYSAPDSTMSHADRDALYAGLKKAGHTLTIVSDADALTDALRGHHYDVVIAAIGSMATVDAATASATDRPHLLPVVARSAGDLPDVREHYKAFLVDGASLGQYLKSINTMMASAKS